MSEIWGIILAAGESRRMKSPKMLLPYDNSTILEKVIENVNKSEVNKALVVLGSSAEDILKVIGDLQVKPCFNENFREGMFSSVKCGFNSLPDSADAAIVFLGDQPRISPLVINLLIRAYHKSGKGIIVPVHNNKRGHPILIDMKYRDEIMNLNPEIGLKALTQKYPDDIQEVDSADEAVLTDIDTQEDYYKELNQIS